MMSKNRAEVEPVITRPPPQVPALRRCAFSPGSSDVVLVVGVFELSLLVQRFRGVFSRPPMSVINMLKHKQ